MPEIKYMPVDIMPLLSNQEDFVVKLFVNFLKKESNRTKKNIDATKLSEVAYLYYSKRMEKEAKKSFEKYNKRVHYIGLSMILVFGSLFVALWWTQYSQFYNFAIIFTLILLCMPVFWVLGILVEQSKISSARTLDATKFLKEKCGNHYMSIVMKHLNNKSEE